MNEQADRETRSIKTHVFMSAGRWEKMKRGNRWSAIGRPLNGRLHGENGMERTTEAKRCLYGDDARGVV